MNALEAQVFLREKCFHNPRQKSKNVSDLRHGLEVAMPRLRSEGFRRSSKRFL